MGEKTFWWLYLSHAVHQQLACEPRCSCVWLSVLPEWGCDNRRLFAGSSATFPSTCSQALECMRLQKSLRGLTPPSNLSPLTGELDTWGTTTEQETWFCYILTLILAWDSSSWGPVPSHVSDHGSLSHWALVQSFVGRAAMLHNHRESKSHKIQCEWYPHVQHGSSIYWPAVPLYMFSS